MKRRIIALMLSMAITLSSAVSVMADDFKSMYITCYCPESCPGEITYTGAKVRKGIAAVTEEHIGDCAIVFTEEGEFIGYFECLDKIGTGKSTVIDIWRPNMDECYEIMKLTGGKVKVQFVEADG